MSTTLIVTLILAGLFIGPFILILLGLIAYMFVGTVVVCWAPLFYWTYTILGLKVPKWALDCCFHYFNMKVYNWQK